MRPRDMEHIKRVLSGRTGRDATWPDPEAFAERLEQAAQLQVLRDAVIAAAKHWEGCIAVSNTTELHTAQPALLAAIRRLTDYEAEHGGAT